MTKGAEIPEAVAPMVRRLDSMREEAPRLLDGLTGVAEYEGGDDVMALAVRMHAAIEQLSPADSIYRQDANMESPILQLNNWIEQPKPSPENARDVNQFKTLIDRIRRCERRRGLDVNILAVDFYDEGDVLCVANKLNGLDRNARASVREIG